MRVISGKLKGRSIETINDHSTRPTSDKVKESLFNIIGPYFSSGKVLDLFAGSGGLGIEAISRGADHAIFVDQQRRVVQVIKKNLASLNITEQAEVYQNDAFRALKALGKRKVKFNYIFIDPPYNKNVYQLLMEEIVKQNIISNDTIIVCEHDQKLNLADQIALFKKTRTEKYGSSIAISFYKRKDEENE
ncbi:16S rRNA (guanine(966)-N(2))-methyltransferase RsmD [Amphibacillus xylanus]|uniref:Putative methyltransferase n=1 Tax=Amphibacillus xylanus (strain ATCC 51415 / DSM 6626 / JCM 7361 / LMG 17667 / NBRC 15112 / Ep01) TaxID=698758 RepID=K0J3L5_AMPXN|nr:16S rRNA (guanine(966)-N(2))-methyltransferase RsmD [Amphibacillus xylanus]BAM47737.1 putative methyltransferase [Amphibacillus xylanus NBRC 15112]